MSTLAESKYKRKKHLKKLAEKGPPKLPSGKPRDWKRQEHHKRTGNYFTEYESEQLYKVDDPHKRKELQRYYETNTPYYDVDKKGKKRTR